MSKNRFKEAMTIGRREIILSPRPKFSPIPFVTVPVFIGLPHSRTNIFKTTLAKVSDYPQGELPYESDGDARRKIQIKSLRETIVVVAQA